jgi:hypothetical protein
MEETRRLNSLGDKVKIAAHAQAVKEAKERKEREERDAAVDHHLWLDSRPS